MTDYNDGLIHGWNGGECPVHVKTLIDVWTGDGDKLTDWPAGNLDWDNEPNPVVAFRVTKAFKEPRDFWITLYDGMAWDDRKAAEGRNQRLGDRALPIIHVREVLE